MNRASPSLQIPDYSLYGEPPGIAFPDVLHVEAIADRSGPRRWRISSHRHKALHQIFWIADGGGVASIDGLERRIGPNTMINIPAGIVHGFRFATKTLGAVVTIPLDIFEPLRAEIDPAGLLTGPSFRRDVGEPPDMLDALFRERGEQRPYRSAALRAYIGLLIAWYARQIAGSFDASQQGKGAGALIFARFQAAVEERFTTEHRIAAYAEALNVSLSHLSRLSRQFRGQPASRVLRNRQMLEARRLLAYTQMNVSDIAYRLGFSDPAYFARVFSMQEGHSPRDFRKAFTDRAG